VRINGRPALPGTQVDPAQDRVTVDGRPVRPPGPRVYVVLNKPRGVLTTVRDERGRPTVLDRVATPRRLFPVGRLDLESRGLVLLTDDGELAARLLHPRYHVEKEYRVRLRGRPTKEALRRVREGITVGEERYAPAQVRGERLGPPAVLRMVLVEGRKREIRRMWSALGERVEDLERLRLGTVQLGRLPPGATRALTRAEVTALRLLVGLP